MGEVLGGSVGWVVGGSVVVVVGLVVVVVDEGVVVVASVVIVVEAEVGVVVDVVLDEEVVELGSVVVVFWVVADDRGGEEVVGKVVVGPPTASRGLNVGGGGSESETRVVVDDWMLTGSSEALRGSLVAGSGSKRAIVIRMSPIRMIPPVTAGPTALKPRLSRSWTAAVMAISGVVGCRPDAPARCHGSGGFHRGY
jgi:hypothetical protein